MKENDPEEWLGQLYKGHARIRADEQVLRSLKVLAKGRGKRESSKGRKEESRSKSEERSIKGLKTIVYNPNRAVSIKGRTGSQETPKSKIKGQKKEGI